MGIFHGILVYEILENGNLLNGIYTNKELADSTYGVDNEIARKKQTSKFDTGIEGSFDCSWIESIEGQMYHCDLEIEKQSNVYVFTWKEEGVARWTGIGLLSGTTHISVSFIDA